MDLKVGNFKDSASSQYEDLDLSKTPTVDPTLPPAPVEPVEPVDIVEPDELVVPPAPVEPVEPIKPVEPVETQPVEPSSLKPINSDPKPEDSFEFNESKTFEYLSEKLGKKIESYDDLKTTQAENPLDSDPYLKELHEWRSKTGRPIEDWIKYQKDYTKLNDLDVAREFLQHEYPTFTPAEINEELKSFQSDDMDDDSDISKKARELKKYSTKGRSVLGELVSQLGDVSATTLPPEVQKDLQLAKQVKDNYKINQEANAAYDQNIARVSKSTDVLKLKLSDNLVVDYKVSDESKETLPSMINNMPHWKNTDGTWNHQAVVEDAIKVKHFDDMLKLAFEQGKNSGEEEIIKQTNNTTLGQPAPMAGGHPSGKGIEIEGFDDYVGKSKMQLKFRK
jgi:hypothetical protein